MGFLDIFFKRSKRPTADQPEGASGTVTRFDRANSRGVIELDNGGAVNFVASKCFFQPFEALPVVVVRMKGSEALEVRLAQAAHPRYGELLDEQSEAEALKAGFENEVVLAAHSELLAKRFVKIGETLAVDAELETTIENDPDDLDARLVYADLLQEHGEPLGELIAAEHTRAGREDGADDALEERIAQLRADQERLAGLDRDLVRVEWNLGLIDAVRVDAYETGGDATAALTTLLGTPAARFLRRLTVGMLDSEDHEDYAGELILLLKAAGPLPALHELHIGDFDREQLEMSWSGMPNPLPYEMVPNLRRLVLRAGEMDLGDIDLPRLEHFEVQTGGLSKSNIAAITEAKWPQLRSLVVWFGDEEYGADANLDDLAPILDASGIPQLTELGLMNADFTDDICRALPDSKIPAQLTKLDLSMGVMSDDGAAALVKEADRFSHLETLNVSENHLSPAGITSLEALGVRVVSHDQKDDDDGHRYVSVGE